MATDRTFSIGLAPSAGTGAPQKKRRAGQRGNSGNFPRWAERDAVSVSSNVAGKNLLFPAFLLFLSGFASLIYQILWVKQLSLVVGVDIHAIAIGVSAFFAGLALGNWLIGRRADQLSRPFYAYACLEIGIALLGITSTLLLSRAAPWFATFENRAGLIAWILPFALVGLPAIPMGGTLPLLVRAVRASSSDLATVGGRLYAANTIGAIFGALFAPFCLIPAFGVRGAAIVAAVVNVFASLASFGFSLKSGSPNTSNPVHQNGTLSNKNRMALILYAITGGLAMGCEVIWSNALVQWTSTRTFAFAIVLATYLAGLVLGSAWFARRANRSSDPAGSFGLLIAAVGLCALLGILFAGSWLGSLQVRAATLAFKLTAQEPIAMAARFFVAAACIVFVPTFFLGAAFPAALRLTANGQTPGRDTGTLLAINIAGGILGTLVTGFILVPNLGLERSLSLIAIALGAIGILSVTFGGPKNLILRYLTIGCAALILLSAVFIRSDHLAQLLASARGGKLIFHEPSTGGTVAIVEQSSGQNRFRRLYIQGVSNSGDSLTSLRYMRLQALLPLLIHRDEPRSALVIGLGTGITAGTLLSYPGLEQRVCAELLPAVARGASHFQGNQGVVSDSRIDLRIRDGRRELLRTADTYDLITLEPPPPSAAGVANLYSSDFYKLAASRLRSNGLLAQWLPLPTQTDADTRSLVRSFLDVFPHATLWTTEFHEMLLIGSLQPIELDVQRISARFSLPGVSASLREVGVASPAALLACWITDRAGLERYAGTTPPTTDDRPRIEYGSWVLPAEILRALPNLLALKSPPPVINVAATEKAAIARETSILAAFYEATLFAYRRNPSAWKQTLGWVLHEDPENPYYRWFVNDFTEVR